MAGRAVAGAAGVLSEEQLVMTDGIIRAQIDGVWSSIRRRIEEKVAEINSNPGGDHLHLDLGNVVGLVNVWAYDNERKTMYKVGFELAMNTGGLLAWYEENLTRWPLAVDLVRDKDTLCYRFEGAIMDIEALIDRVVERWEKKMSAGLFNQYS
jgi:hypothetical protein